MPRLLGLACLLLCALNSAWAQPAPALDPATRAALWGRGGVPGGTTTNVQEACAAGPALQNQVNDARTATPPPVDCAQILGTPPAPGVGVPSDRDIAPYQVQSRTARGEWRAVGGYGSLAGAREAANAACMATSPVGTPRPRAVRVMQTGLGELTQVDCRAARLR